MSEHVPATGASGRSLPVIRPRRLRRTPSLRRLVAETHVAPRQLVLPMFVREGIDEPQPISSMPGMVQGNMAWHSRQASGLPPVAVAR